MLVNVRFKRDTARNVINVGRSLGNKSKSREGENYSNIHFLALLNCDTNYFLRR